VTYKIKLDLTRDNYTADEIEAALLERLKAKKLKSEERDLLVEYAFDVQDSDDDELAAVKRKLQDAVKAVTDNTAKAEAAEKRLREINQQAFEYIDGVDTDLADIDDEIKQFLLRQTFSERKGAYEFKSHGFRVARSRTNKVAVTYAGEEVLEARPDLKDVEVDGDRLFRLVINEGLADRLLEDDETPEDVRELLKAHRKETFKRNPSIKFAVADGDGSDV